MSKIVYYTGAKVQDALMVYAYRHFTGVKRDSALNYLGSLFRVGNLVNSTAPIDRTGLYEYPYSFNYTPLPSSPNYAGSFADACLDKAQRVWAMPQQKKMLWSGGIDSTAMLVAMILTNSLWDQSLQIVTSSYAIQEEYPWFFQNIIQPKGNYRLIENSQFFDEDLYTPDTVVINGFVGDHLWGPPAKTHYRLRALGMEALLSQPYTALFNKVEVLSIRDEKMADRASKTFFNTYIETVVANAPTTITTVMDLLWYLNFAFRWDHPVRRHWHYIQNSDRYSGFYVFYNDPLFEQWALSNPMSIKYPGEWKTYKQPAKDFIHSYTGDEDYRVNKLKLNSLELSTNLVPAGNNVYGIVDDQGARTVSVIVNGLSSTFLKVPDQTLAGYINSNF
jgi:hypothetical protein